VLGLLVLAATAITLFALLPASHAPRILAVLVAVALGLCFLLVPGRGMEVRCLGLALGIGLAGVAWYIVPTTRGLNLWSAYRERDDLLAAFEGSLPLCDATEFENAKVRCRELTGQFPEFAAPLDEAQDAWLKRSQERWQQQLAELPAGDVGRLAWLARGYGSYLTDDVRAAELDWFRRTYQALPPGDFALARRVHALAGERQQGAATGRAEADWVGRATAAGVAEAKGLLPGEPAKASARLQGLARNLSDLGQHPTAQEQVLAARKAVALAWLEDARLKGWELVTARRFQAAADGMRSLAQELGEEARAVQLHDDLTRLVDAYRFLADLNRQASGAKAKR
jgi:hypothetical protein